MTGPSLEYLVESLPWAVAGFLAGSLATRKAAPPPVSPREIPMASTETPTPSLPRRRRPTLVHIIGLVVVALTITSAIQTWVQSRETERQRQVSERQQEATERLTQCLVVYANATADAIEVRSKASQEAQAATVQMWLTVFDAPPTDAGRANARTVFKTYLDKQAAAIKTQQANPYPPAPRTLCPDSAR